VVRIVVLSVAPSVVLIVVQNADVALFVQAVLVD